MIGIMIYIPTVTSMTRRMFWRGSLNETHGNPQGNCGLCGRKVLAHESVCPHCGSVVRKDNGAHEKIVSRRKRS